MRYPFWLSREEVRDFDRQAIERYGVPGIILMENAGRGCAELLMRLNPKKLRAVILCGPGNNGGDGYVIARHLDAAGWPVDMVAVEPPITTKTESVDTKVRFVRTGFNFDGLPPDALTNFNIAANSQLKIFKLNGQTALWLGSQNALTSSLIQSDCWVVDALFGTGLSRPLISPYDELIALINISGKPVLAVDIPSGLDCDSGEPLGATVRAKHTATFVALKKGFLNPASKAWTGEVHVMRIGAPARLVEEFREREYTSTG